MGLTGIGSPLWSRRQPLRVNTSEIARSKQDGGDVRYRRWLMLLALVASGLVINVAIGQLVRNVLRLPVYLDSIGTILVGALAGPLAGAVTGALSNVIWSLVFDDSSIAAYAITAACIGAAAGIAASFGVFRRPLPSALAGLLTGVMAALVSAPITAHVLQGSGGGGAETVQGLLRATGANVLQAATLQGFISDPVDKMVSFLAVWAILALLPETLRQRLAPAASMSRSYRQPSRYGVAIVASLLALGFAIVFLPAFGPNVYAVFYVAVALSAWNGGLGPALLAIGIGATATIVLPVNAQGSAGLRPEDWLSLCIFLLVSCLIALITEALERALVEQRRREAEIRSIVDSVVEALLLVAPDQRVTSVNRQFEELFAVAASQITGRRVEDLQPVIERVFAEPEGVAARVGASVDDSNERITETLVQKWPQERQLELVSLPVRSTGTFLGRLYGFRDVTQERELDRMKTEFVSQVSHELRTPLTAIKGFTEMLLDRDAGEVNEEQEEYLKVVSSNVDRLVVLINDLLDISRIESGRIQLKVESIDLQEIIESVVATMRPLINGKQQTLVVEIQPNLPAARGDHDRILQVVTNLVSNAHKYTPAGGRISIEATQAGEQIGVAVHDSGIGIGPDDLPRLFTRFFRVDSSLTREIGGTGLGLSIVKSIVELHGGSVSVRSEAGKGSTFRFALPIATSGTEDEDEPVPQAEQAPAPALQPTTGP
jgi:PAS domain S-box-containing protein